MAESRLLPCQAERVPRQRWAWEGRFSLPPSSPWCWLPLCEGTGPAKAVLGGPAPTGRPILLFHLFPIIASEGLGSFPSYVRTGLHQKCPSPDILPHCSGEMGIPSYLPPTQASVRGFAQTPLLTNGFTFPMGAFDQFCFPKRVGQLLSEKVPSPTPSQRASWAVAVWGLVREPHGLGFTDTRIPDLHGVTGGTCGM